MGKRQFIFLLVVVIAVLFLSWSFLRTSWDEKTSRLVWKESHSLCSESDIGSEAWTDSPPLRRKVAIASTFGFHFDVYLAVAWTLQRVFKRSPQGGQIRVYANTPFAYDFGTIIEKLGLYDGPYQKPESLVEDLIKGELDLVILGTCEVDLRGQWNDELLAAWDSLPADKKFKLICIVHHVQDAGWQKAIPQWSRRDSLRLLPISEHVAKGFRHAFDVEAERDLGAGYEYIPIDVHVPILNIPDLENSAQRSIPSNIVIQGSFATDRRDYLRFFDELSASLSEDPAVWGYLPLEGRPSYVPDPGSDSPFRVYLAGSGWLNIPTELSNIVTTHTGLNYTEYYALIGRMDLCVPAFAENGYYEYQASSTFVMALECDLPILVNERMKRSYTYANNEAVIITRPAAVREVAALRALRSNDSQHFTDISHEGMQMNPHISATMDKMVQRGWKRDKSGFKLFKQNIWTENERVMERIIRDVH